MQRRTRRRGWSLPELLVCMFVLAMVYALTLAQGGTAIDPEAHAGRQICLANKRNLEAARTAWQLRTESPEPLALPAGYPELLREGLITEIPHEPGTSGWSHTYVTSPGGNLVCRVHDLKHRWNPAEDLDRHRILLLEIFAACLLFAAYGVWRWARQRPRVSVLRGVSSRRSTLGPDGEVASEVRDFLRELREGPR